MRYEFRHALRTMRRERGLFVATLLTLGLGIGVATALFAVVDTVLLAPLVPAQDRVVHVSKRDVARGGFPSPLSLPEFEEWRRQAGSLEALVAVNHAATGTVAIALDGRLARGRLAPVTAGFFEALYRREPLLGRWLRPDDETAGEAVAAVVSEAFWERLSGRDPALVGRRLIWNGTRALRVVGVAHASVDYPIGTDIWAPASAVFDGRAGRFDARDRTFAQFELLGRLRAGASIETAGAELDVVHRRLVEAFPNDYRPMQVVVEPLLHTVVGDNRRLLLALLAGAALVFAVAGVNVAALLLMRASGRETEMAVRVALGASRGRLLRQAMAEGLVLAGGAAVTGLLIARALLVALPGLAPDDVPRLERATIDVSAAAFATLAALIWVIGLGTAPVWARRRLAHLSGVARAFQGGRRAPGLLMFTAAQIGAAVVLAIGAGLLVRSFAQLSAIDRGVTASGVSMVTLSIPEDRRRDPKTLVAFYERLLAELRAVPGVIAATPVHLGPGTGTMGLSAPMLFEGQTGEEARANPWAAWEPVFPDYFGTLGIPIVSGRGFTEADGRDAMPVAIVSESVAGRYWPGLDPIGRRLQFVPGAKWPWVTVVGVARDTRYRELRKSWLTVYFPADQFFFFQATSVLVRGNTGPALLRAELAPRVEALMPGAVVDTIDPLHVLLSRELARPRAALAVAGLFAVLAMGLAAIGIYAVLSYEVRQRRQELAIRAAVGATPHRLMKDVLRRGLVVAITGTAIGGGLAAVLTRALGALLFEVPPVDAVVFATVMLATLLVALGATFRPAGVAASVNPTDALRTE